MDNRIRRNDICIIGQPQCGYAFSSTRSCFIAYGYSDSPLEVDILSAILVERNIEPVQAGDRLSSGQNAFCTKICSKIITAQFCAVFVNHDIRADDAIPNANVYMEYGMMLGFNKYVVPFQSEHQTLAFNVAGLDTVKYNQRNFKALATAAIDKAIADTTPRDDIPTSHQIIDIFFLANNVMASPLDNEAELTIANRAKGLGYTLINDFTGFHYFYFGIVTQDTAAGIKWKLEKTRAILDGMMTSADLRVTLGFNTIEERRAAQELISRFGIWLVVGDEQVKGELDAWLSQASFPHEVRLTLASDVFRQFNRIMTGEEYLDGNHAAG